jgi:hypothetical protein
MAAAKIVRHGISLDTRWGKRHLVFLLYFFTHVAVT